MNKKNMYRIKTETKLPNTKIILERKILGLFWVYWYGTKLYGYDIDFHRLETKEIIESLKKDYKII